MHVTFFVFNDATRKLKIKFLACIMFLLDNADLKTSKIGTSLMVQWLRLCTSSSGDAGLIPGQGTRIPHKI